MLPNDHLTDLRRIVDALLQSLLLDIDVQISGSLPADLLQGLIGCVPPLVEALVAVHRELAHMHKLVGGVRVVSLLRHEKKHRIDGLEYHGVTVERVNSRFDDATTRQQHGVQHVPHLAEKRRSLIEDEVEIIPGSIVERVELLLQRGEDTELVARGDLTHPERLQPADGEIDTWIMAISATWERFVETWETIMAHSVIRPLLCLPPKPGTEHGLRALKVLVVRWKDV